MVTSTLVSLTGFNEAFKDKDCAEEEDDLVAILGEEGRVVTTVELAKASKMKALIYLILSPSRVTAMV